MADCPERLYLSGKRLLYCCDDGITAEGHSAVFLAVLLVMAGTYLVFTAGSIAVLKMLRWKKSFYYKMKNFTSVSGMIYRMKQNAVGLASICILSTGVLLMLSSTVCLNFGIEDVMHNRYPCDLNVAVRYVSLDEARNAVSTVLNAVEKEQIPYTKLNQEVCMDIACVLENGEVVFREPENISDLAVGCLSLIPAAEFARMTGETADLEGRRNSCIWRDKRRKLPYHGK